MYNTLCSVQIRAGLFLMRKRLSHQKKEYLLMKASRFLLILLTMLGCGAYTYEAAAFGVSPYLGSMKEHAQITRLALACDSQFEPQNKPRVCFDPVSGSNLYSYKFYEFVETIKSIGSFSAVEAPDNFVTHGFSGGPPWWHCDDADHLDVSGYPQDQKKAFEHLMECRKWAQRKLGDGLAKSDPLCDAPNYGTIAYNCYGAADKAHLMLNSKGNVSVSQPDAQGNGGTFGIGGDCNYDGSSGRIKCSMLESFGYTLHTIQDFYSHSNYADTTSVPFGIDTPQGLNNTELPSFWDLTVKDVSVLRIPQGVITGCHPDDDCSKVKRVTHGKLNKDNASIMENGSTDGPQMTGAFALAESFRGKMRIAGIKNNERAVRMAIRATRKAWDDLQTLIIRKEGRARANAIICAIASDNPNNCTSAGKLSQNALHAHAVSAVVSTSPEYEPKWVTQNNKALLSGNPIPYRYKSPDLVDGVAGWTSCGDQVIRVDSNKKKIPLKSIFVENGTCHYARSILTTYARVLKGSKGLAGKLPEGFSCMVIPKELNNLESTHGVICKSDVDSVEIDFIPNCPGGVCEE